MKKISKVAIHNVYKEGATAVVDCPTAVTILTGYNGVGKSTTLAVIHSTISLFGDREYLFPRTNWASQIYFDSGSIVNHVKIGRLVGNDFSVSLPKKNISSVDDLKIFFKNVVSTVMNVSKHKNILVSKEGDRRDSRSTNVLSVEVGKKNRKNKPGDEPEPLEAGLQSVLYCDELFDFSASVDESENLDELDIFSKKNTLDKTLYMLLRQFSVLDQSSSVNESFISLIGSIKGMFEQGSMPDELRRKVDIFEANVYVNSHEHFLREANIFFRMTGREAFVSNEGLLSVRLDSNGSESEEVRWFNLSKGEKTLLSLLLAAFLSRGKSTIFLLDEPDLSLHLRWQKQLMKSLCTLAPDAQFIVSTHSPAMIGTVDDERILNISSFSKG